MQRVISASVQQVGHTLPDIRLRRVLEKAVLGIIAHRSPLISRMASVTPTGSEQPDAPLKQLYHRFFSNQRVSGQTLWQSLYATPRALVASAQPAVVPVIINGVNLEKPYARKMPRLSTIRKDAAPNRRHTEKLPRGFPALACVPFVGRVPALAFAHLFSYTSSAFVSVNSEVLQAILTARLVLHGHVVRFIGDKGLDDDQTIACMARHGQQFLVRAYYHRTIEVRDASTQAWRRSSLQDCADTLPLQTHFFAFVLRCGGPCRADDTAIVLRHPPVGFAQDRTVDQDLDNRGLQIVRHQAMGHTTPELKGAAMQTDPGGDLLIEDELGILVPAEGQRGNENVGGAGTAALGIVQLADGAEIDLRFLAGGRMHPHHGLRFGGTELMDKAPDG